MESGNLSLTRGQESVSNMTLIFKMTSFANFSMKRERMDGRKDEI